MGHTASIRWSRRICAVHPHIRGAYRFDSSPNNSKNGSSPHTWGIRSASPRISFLSRFIPTYVGHTRKPVPPSSLPTGSSPHTWGIHSVRGLALGHQRFIPTYVGHTEIVGKPMLSVRFIPTYVGHTSMAVDSPLTVTGSSPHTWGIRRSATHSAPASRFIPTYVGHTFRSSPRQTPPRFIPTYVGHTTRPPSPRPSITVHPHIRGAYIPCQRGQKLRSGSSPHTWGIQLPAQAVQVDSRFIPTYVGHTFRSSPRQTPPRFIPTYVGHTPGSRCPARCGSVHPHIRGAYVYSSSNLSR